MIEVTAELLSHHDKPGPRYTSYPTAIEFTESFGRQDYEKRLAAASRRPDAPLSLYVHLPFCESRCSFCACHVVVSRHPEVADAYLRHLVSEAGLLASRLGDRRTVTQYHWGGGTPTFHSPDTLVRLHAAIAQHIDLTDDAEMSIEADPRVTTAEHLEALTSVGFSRISFGVQDLDPEVQRLIGRDQTREQTIDLYEQARRLGFVSINLDLIYGLPGQDEQTLGHTIDEVLELRPDRLAVYSFAFVPWMRPHQRRLDKELLPGTDEKFGLLALVVSRLTSAGYTHIGMDHFALPDDELALAAAEGTLTRTFMGYTTKRDTEMVALGTSGISDVDGAYAQNHRRLASYYEDIAAGHLPIERGYRLDDDDRLRRFVITELMCNGVVDLSAAVERFEMGQREDFRREIAELTTAGGLVDEGLATLNSSVVEATELGMLFIRRIATIFDAHRDHRPTDRPMFSKTV